MQARPVFFALAMTVAACTSAEEVAIADHADCVSLGFQPGTDAYGNCRLQLREIRAHERQTIALEHARFHRPYGWAPRYSWPYDGW